MKTEELREAIAQADLAIAQAKDDWEWGKLADARMQIAIDWLRSEVFSALPTFETADLIRAVTYALEDEGRIGSPYVKHLEDVAMAISKQEDERSQKIIELRSRSN